METVQHVSPGMPTQAQLSYAPRPTLQYSLSNPATLPLGGSGSFKVSSAQSTSIPYPSYPGSSDLSSRYVQPSSQYNSTDRPSSNSTSSYNENNHSSPLIGRSDRNSTSNTSLGEYMPPKSRAVLNSDHRSSHPSNRINSTDTYPESILNTAYHVDHGAPPNKRIKYNEAVKPELHQPLRVDTTERTVYNPPVEAISPTLPPPPPPPPPAPPPNSAQQNANSPETFAGAATAAATETNDKQDEAVINVDSYSCSNKPTELIDLLIKIEDEIRKTDQQIQQLKKKQKEMEENSNSANTADKIEPECEEIVLPKLIQVAKRIYDENWDKAHISHQFFVKFGALEDLPLYNQAPDTEIYHENTKKYTGLRPFLIDKIRKEKQAKEARDQNIAITYNKMSAEWKRKLEKIENSQKRKARDLKNREVFEKVFPELRKQREDKERFSRSGGRVRSEADLEEIMDGLQEQEVNQRKILEKGASKLFSRGRAGGGFRSGNPLNPAHKGIGLEDKKMRSYAVIPPLMLDSKQRRYSFINNNGLITDLPKVAKENEYYNIWTESEKEIFKEKFLQHPKNFGVIASYLEKKTVCECVAYYYHSKKTEHYKRLLRKSRRTRARNLQGKASGNNASGLANPGDLLYNNTPGVTTRLQREQIQQQQQRQEQPQNLSVAATSTSSSSTTSMAGGSTSATPSTTASTATTTSTTVTESTLMDTSPSTNTSSGTTTTTSAAESNVEISTTTFLNGAEATTATVPSSSTDCSANAAGAKTSSEVAPSNDTTELAAKVVPDTVLDGRSAISPVSPAGNAVNNDAVKSEPKPDIKKKERRKDDKKKNDTNTQGGDTSEEDTLPSERNDKGSTHPCLVCKTDAVSSRALPRSHAQQYGLREDEVMPGARVCNLCRCKAVRSRYMHCPLPTCPNTKGNRVKRLRTLPCKWADLPVHIKQPVIAEFQIPPTATKCCSACFNRIQRRLIQMGVVASQGDDTSTSPTSSSQLTKWTDEEIETLKRGIAENGTKWSEVSQMVGPSKTQYQCKMFYFNYRKKLGLDVALQEYNKKHFGEERKPTLSTDEEESGSTTSSCDELDRSVPDDSDTASAPSPAMNNDTSEINTEIDLSVNSEGGIGSAVITKTPLMSDMQMDISSLNTSATAISNLPGSTSPLKCTPPVISHLISKEDYDSSATETADEGVGVGVDNENTSSSADHGGKSNVNNVGGEREKVMADVIGGLIEFQLSKPSQVPGLSQAPNSISSMVDQNLFECDQRQQKARENSLATLSLVSSVHHPGHCESMKDGVVYLQMPSSKESPREHETGTLDLSMKKPRSPEFLNNHMVHNTQSVHPSSVSKNSNSHPHNPLIAVPPHQSHVYKHPPTHEPANSNYYHHQQHQIVEVAKITKTGEPLFWRLPLNQPHLAMPQHQLITVKQPQTHPKLLNKVSSPQQLNQNIKLSPKQSPNGVSSSAGLNVSMNQQSKLGGSIMHGTPVSSANLYPTNARDGRYDAPLLRQITPPSHQGSPLIKETGSITQGTPVHQRGSSHSNSSAEYYSQSNSKRSGAIPATTFYPNRPHSYNDEQRQHIIMTDFVTSQHLCNMKETLQQQPRDKPYYYPPRQGVIQRHNTNPPGTPISKSVSPHPSYPPGHEALGSLVDVAIQQPSLPVPLSHSSSASNVVVSGQHKGDKQRLIIQEGLGDRFSRDAIPKERYLGRVEPREPERYSREPPQLHHQQGPPPPPSSHHDPPPPQMQREHQLTSHQLRENHLQREREQRQQELRDQQLHQHYREQQQKLREQEQRMMRDQGKHRELLSQMQPSIRDSHMQPPPHLQQQQREVDSHQYQRSSSANSRLAPEPPPHARIQQIPTSIYQPHRVHSNPPEQPIDSRIATTINYHREAPPGSVKTDSGRDSARPRQGDSSTVTAASLIDAIITHQINQPSDVAVSATASQASSSPHVPSARPGDKLFQVFPEPDGKLSPLKCTSTIQSRASPDVKSQPPQLQPQQPPPPSSAHQQHSLPVSSAGSMHGDPNNMRDGGPPTPRNIGPPTLPPSSSQSQHVYMEPPAWKLRRALQHKELEQQSADRNIVRIAGVQRPLSPREKLGGLQSNPLDYVRNKIVEEMHRTSDDEGGARSSGNSNHGSVVGRSEDSNGSGDQPNQPSYLPASNYAYPYSALNINSQVPVAAHTTPSAPPKPVDVPEPTPILSSQYEPLSDED